VDSDGATFDFIRCLVGGTQSHGNDIGSPQQTRCARHHPASQIEAPDCRRRRHPGVGQADGEQKTLKGGGDSALALRKHLAQQGCAVLRVPFSGDAIGDEGDSPLGELDARASHFAAYVRQRPEVQRAPVGPLGHSMGGLIATLAASRSADIDLVVASTAPVESMNGT
jgi:alpha-beta hydrolase superfamily lysophospholipase